MNLKDFYDYKNQLMGDLLTTESIVHLLDADISMEDADSLAYTQVFPFEYVPETIQEGKTYICFDVDVQSSEGPTFLTPYLYIWVFTHKSLLRLPDGRGVLTDELASEICKKINGSLFYGLGELDFYSSRRFAPMTDYQGKVLTFHTREFSRVYNPNKTIPVNRKTG